MRLLKLAAFLSLWAVFFALVGIVHVWISVLGLPNRWKIISRLNRNYTLLLRLILNIKVTIAGDEGQLERGGYVIIANHVSYVDGIGLGSIFPIIFVSKREVKKWPAPVTTASPAEARIKICCSTTTATAPTNRRPRYFPVSCFLIFSTNSLSMASAFLRMIGWPNSPILPRIFTSVSTASWV